MRAFDILTSVVDVALPLPPTDTDLCRPDCYPPIPLFPFRLPDMTTYTRKEVEDDA